MQITIDLSKDSISALIRAQSTLSRVYQVADDHVSSKLIKEVWNAVDEEMNERK